MIRWIALSAAVALGATAGAATQSSQMTKAEKELAKALEGRVAGEAKECISSSFLQGPEIIDDKTILYREVGRTIWRNDVIGPCPSLAPMETLVVEMHGAQLCRNDRFRVLPFGGGIPSAPCRLGKFVPYKKM
jgi:hypothetical protein